jgi:hypothetical protein
VIVWIVWSLVGVVVAVGAALAVAWSLRDRSIPQPVPTPKMAHVTPLALTPQQIARFPRLPPVVHHLHAINPGDGWPPKLARAKSPRTVTPLPPLTVLDSRREDRLRRHALQDPRIKALLGGRWEYLGCHQTEQRNYRHDGALHARLSFYNYTARHAIDVELVDDEIVEVRRLDGYMPPEGPIEIRQAIAMARADGRLNGKVEALDSHAILQSPTEPAHPLGGRRILWVVFSEPDDPRREMPARFAALVDLTEQKVVWAGEAPCRRDGER